MENAPNMEQLFKGVSEFAPIIVTGFLFMNSAFNLDAKALVWVGPVIVWMIALRFLQPFLGNKTPDTCSKWLGQYSNPCLSSFLIMYTLGYIGAPMPVHNDWNYMAIAAFLFLFGIDAVVKYKTECGSFWGIVNGGVFGIAIGSLMYFIFKWAGLEKVLYYTTGDSNRVYCSKPKEQSFKCHVYKNGNIISSL
jgi:hypothetical protein